MKTNTFNKDIMRSVKHSLSRFIAIFAIVALGAGFFAGLSATAPDMRLTADKYYDDSNMMDFHLLSSLGFTDEDIAQMRRVDGVDGVMAGYSVDAESLIGDKEQVMRIHSLPDDMSDTNEDYINRPVLVKGRMPQNDSECLLGVSKIDLNKIDIGSKISLENIAGESDDLLKVREFTVVGLVQSSYYISFTLGTSSIGNGNISHFLFVPQGAFNSEVYTDVFATMSGAAELDCFGREYKAGVDTSVESLKTVAKEREKIRYNEVMEEATAKIDDAQKQLDEKRAEAENALASARRELESAEQQAADGERGIASGESAIANSRAALKKQEAVLDSAEKQYLTGLAGYTTSKADYDAKQAAFNMSKADWQAMYDRWEKDKADYESLGVTDAAKEAQLAADKAQLDAQKQVLDKNEQSLAAAKAVLDATLLSLDDAKAKLDSGRQAAAAGKARLDSASAQLAGGRVQIENARSDIKAGWEKYYSSKAEADEKLAEAEDELINARIKVSEIEKPEWYVLTRESNVGFVSFESDANRMGTLAGVFPILFFLVAALVALTTMTRMVEEERELIGTYKALGYSNGKIISKYILYALTATVSGALVGVVIGFIALPVVCWNSYRMLYIAPNLIIKYHIGYAVGGLMASLICTLGSTLAVCHNVLSEYPSTLMLPKAPKAGKRVFLERIGFIWKRLSFIGKVTCRNLLRYKKRLIMTVVGVAGCTGLLLTGFGVKDSISDIIHNQFDEIYKYNTVIETNSTELSSRAQGLLDDKNNFTDYTFVRQKTGDIEKDGEKVSGYVFVPQNEEELSDFITMQSRTSKKPVEFNADSVIITEKAAHVLGVEIGDEVTIKNPEDKSIGLKITGITENYLQHYLYISPQIYREAMGEEPSPNFILAKCSAEEEQGRADISKKMLKIPDFATMSFTNDISAQFNDMIKTLNYVIAVLIICAGALAFVVIYNLTNINITERRRELATIKVLGFRDKEVAAYIYRETFLLTLIGAILGLGLGVFMHSFVITTVEVDMVMFGRNINLLSFIYSFLITLLFSGIVDIAMLGKLKKIDMVESLKSVD
ncbi:MAG: FtsX-like permease family protein [Oscillospiraceae bacterium]